jgi:hypothetical protein
MLNNPTGPPGPRDTTGGVCARDNPFGPNRGLVRRGPGQDVRHQPTRRCHQVGPGLEADQKDPRAVAPQTLIESTVGW